LMSNFSRSIIFLATSYDSGWTSVESRGFDENSSPTLFVEDFFLGTSCLKKEKEKSRKNHLRHYIKLQLI
jgi:hypothetical protein